MCLSHAVNVDMNRGCQQGQKDGGNHPTSTLCVFRILSGVVGVMSSIGERRKMGRASLSSFVTDECCVRVRARSGEGWLLVGSMGSRGRGKERYEKEGCCAAVIL